MRVVLADKAGSCYGVQRALDMAERLIEDGVAANTLGPIIHNPKVVADLAARGLAAVEGIDDLTCGTVVIRSHGVMPAVREALEAKGLSIVDATCPHVARAQNAARELAATYGAVVVVGEAGHPEVEGLCAYAALEGAHVFVAANGEELPGDLPETVGVVVQTTQTADAYESVLDALATRGIEAHPVNTVCLATKQRQTAAAALAEEADAMVVIGGRNSSNTTRLAEICTVLCPNTHHIEDAAELRPEWFVGCGTVGITAGASTPADQNEAVMARLQDRA